MFKKYKKEILFLIFLIIGFLLNSKIVIAISTFFLIYILFMKNLLNNEIKKFKYSINIKPQYVIEGDTISINYKLNFFNTKILNFELIPYLPTYFIPVDKKNLFIQIEENKEYDHLFKVIAKKRGRYFIGNFKLRLYDVLGVVNIENFFETNFEVIVFPKMINIKKSIVKTIEPSFGLKVKEKIFEDFTSIQGHRKYTGNEEFKKINWKVSAHKGELMVKEFPSTAITSVTIIIDPFASKNSRNQEIYEEHITTISSSFVYFFERSKFNYGLWIPEFVRIKEGNGKDHMIKIISIISELKMNNEFDFIEFLNKNSQEIKNLKNVLILRRSLNIVELYNLMKVKNTISNFTIFLLPDYGFLYPWEKPHPYIIEENEEIENIRKIKDSLKRDRINIIIIRGNENIKDLIFV